MPTNWRRAHRRSLLFSTRRLELLIFFVGGIIRLARSFTRKSPVTRHGFSLLGCPLVPLTSVKRSFTHTQGAYTRVFRVMLPPPSYTPQIRKVGLVLVISTVMDLPEQDQALFSPAFYPSAFSRNELIVYYSLCGLPVADIQKMLREVHSYCFR